mgnify:CR=1 FL=1
MLDDVEQLQRRAGRLAFVALPLAHGVHRHVHERGEHRLTNSGLLAYGGDVRGRHGLDLRQRVLAEHPQRRLPVPRRSPRRPC